MDIPESPLFGHVSSKMGVHINHQTWGNMCHRTSETTPGTILVNLLVNLHVCMTGRELDWIPHTLCLLFQPHSVSSIFTHDVCDMCLMCRRPYNLPNRANDPKLGVFISSQPGVILYGDQSSSVLPGLAGGRTGSPPYLCTHSDELCTSPTSQRLPIELIRCQCFSR